MLSDEWDSLVSWKLEGDLIICSFREIPLCVCHAETSVIKPFFLLSWFPYRQALKTILLILKKNKLLSVLDSTARKESIGYKIPKYNRLYSLCIQKFQLTAWNPEVLTNPKMLSKVLDQQICGGWSESSLRI